MADSSVQNQYSNLSFLGGRDLDILNDKVLTSSPANGSFARNGLSSSHSGRWNDNGGGGGFKLGTPATGGSPDVGESRLKPFRALHSDLPYPFRPRMSFQNVYYKRVSYRLMTDLRHPG